MRDLHANCGNTGGLCGRGCVHNDIVTCQGILHWYSNMYNTQDITYTYNSIRISDDLVFSKYCSFHCNNVSRHFISIFSSSLRHQQCTCEDEFVLLIKSLGYLVRLWLTESIYTNPLSAIVKTWITAPSQIYSHKYWFLTVYEFSLLNMQIISWTVTALICCKALK